MKQNKRYRFTSDTCINCGATVPKSVECSKRHDLWTIYCSKCGDEILNGVVAVNELANVPEAENPPRFLYSEPKLRVGTETNFHRFEIWWTEIQTMAAIHGRQIYGDEGAMQFVYRTLDNL